MPRLLLVLLLGAVADTQRAPGGDKMPELPRISASDLSDPGSPYYSGGRPFVLQLNATARPPLPSHPCPPPPTPLSAVGGAAGRAWAARTRSGRWRGSARTLATRSSTGIRPT